MGTRKSMGAFRICTGCRGGPRRGGLTDGRRAGRRWRTGARPFPPRHRPHEWEVPSNPSGGRGAPRFGGKSRYSSRFEQQAVLLSYPPIVAQIAGHLGGIDRITRIAMVTPHAYPAPASLTSRAAHNGASSPRRRRVPIARRKLATHGSPSGNGIARGRRRFKAVAHEHLDWSSIERTHAREESGLWLPGSRGWTPDGAPSTSGRVDRDADRSGMMMQTSDRAMRAGRRGMLAGAAALTASTAVPTQPARAFIDLPSRLHNRYFLVRHGESTLDVRGQFLSNPSYKYDTTYGLTKKGIYQMHEAARIIADEYDAAPSWLYTSNFQRAFQSALILREDLGLLFSQLRTEFSGLLDPRKMGALDFDSQTKWPEVWAGDEKDSGNTPPPVPASLQPSASVESPRDLYRRALECFTRLESTYFGEDVILVSHADTISLFTAAMMGTDLRNHHKDWNIELGQVRVVDLSGDDGQALGSKFKPTDLRGEYAVGDKATNYQFMPDGYAQGDDMGPM